MIEFSHSKITRTANYMAQSDEEYARELLEAYLRNSGAMDAHCELVENDPPDIVCRVANEKWVIEVTRVDQREVQNRREKSRYQIDRPLEDFGNELRKKVERFRKRKYLLELNAPPPGWKWAAWKKQVQKAVEQFVRSECTGICDFPGGSISAYDQGHDWLIAVGLRDDTSVPGGHMTSDIAANIEVMLRYALKDKSKKLAAVSGFDKIGLVLLNTYFFGNDVEEVAETLRTVILGDTKCVIFDFVFYIVNGHLSLIYKKSLEPAAET